MSLIYRGQAAQPSAIANTVETGMIGTFLGRTFPIRQTQKPARRSPNRLQYRGSIY